MDGLRNLDSCKILLNTFAACTSADMKADILHTLQIILSLRVTLPLSSAYSSPSRQQATITITGYQLLQKRFEPFKTLFLQFDSLSLNNQNMILAMMNRVLEESNLLSEEMKFYCCLLQGKRPSTLLLVANHLIVLIEKQKISRTVLRSVGLIPILIEYLVDPMHLYCRPALTTSDERDFALTILRTMKEKKRNHSSEESRSREHRSDNNSGTESIAQEVVQKQIKKILYSICVRMLKLMLVFLVDNDTNQKEFRKMDGLRRLYTLLTDNVLRGPALRVIAICAIGAPPPNTNAGLTWSHEPGADKSSDGVDIGSCIIRDVINVLQSSGGTASLSKQVLLIFLHCWIYLH